MSLLATKEVLALSSTVYYCVYDGAQMRAQRKLKVHRCGHQYLEFPNSF